MGRLGVLPRPALSSASPEKRGEDRGKVLRAKLVTFLLFPTTGLCAEDLTSSETRPCFGFADWQVKEQAKKSGECIHAADLPEYSSPSLKTRGMSKLRKWMKYSSSTVRVCQRNYWETSRGKHECSSPLPPIMQSHFPHLGKSQGSVHRECSG